MTDAQNHETMEQHLLHPFKLLIAGTDMSWWHVVVAALASAVSYISPILYPLLWGLVSLQTIDIMVALMQTRMKWTMRKYVAGLKKKVAALLIVCTAVILRLVIIHMSADPASINVPPIGAFTAAYFLSAEVASIFRHVREMGVDPPDFVGRFWESAAKAFLPQGKDDKK